MTVQDSGRVGVIAIDGPAGTGKSTVSALVAARLGATVLDTGAMYRAATLAVLNAAVAVDDPDAVGAAVDAVTIRQTAVDGGTITWLDDRDVSTEIRTDAVTEAVSPVSAVPLVRTNLVAVQRESAQGRFVVVEGRDIGTVVFPDAAVKFYLTASPEARAQRRHDQNLEAGRVSDLDEVLANVNRRDHLDSTRAMSPLRPADDAIIVDTGDLTLEQVVDKLVSLVDERIGVQS